MNIKITLALGGAALVIGATTHVVVKNAKKMKEENDRKRELGIKEITEIEDEDSSKEDIRIGKDTLIETQI